VKLWLASCKEDEKHAFKSKLVIHNDRMAKDILYDHSIKNARLRPEEKKKENSNNNNGQPPVEEEEEKEPIRDMNESYEFDCDTGELSSNDRPIDINFRKVDGQKVKKQIVRKLICDRRENRGGSRVRDGSQSSYS
jgi:hypothetical protein